MKLGTAKPAEPPGPRSGITPTARHKDDLSSPLHLTQVEKPGVIRMEHGAYTAEELDIVLAFDNDEYARQIRGRSPRKQGDKRKSRPSR
jgi:hypothetical protein